MNKRQTTAGLLVLLVTLTAACAPLRAAQPETAVAPARHILVLRMSTNGTVHDIVDSMLVLSPVALSPAPPMADGRSLNYAIADGNGKIVFEAGMPNPLEVRSPLSPPGEPAKGHETVVLPQVQYVIRVPYDKTAMTLQIAVGTRPAFAAAGTSALAAPPRAARNFNLQSWVQSAEVKASLR